MQKKSNPSIWSNNYVKLLGVATISGGIGYLFYRHIQKKNQSSSSEIGAQPEDNHITSGPSPTPNEPNKTASKTKKTSFPYLILAGNKNYQKDGKTLCYNITEQEVDLLGDGKLVTKQVYTPLRKPDGYKAPKPKLFEVKCPEARLPTFKETIDPCYSVDGLIALTDELRFSNMQKTAYSFGALAKPDGSINPKANEPDPLKLYAAYIPSYSTLKLLSKVLVSEVQFENNFETQREMASILWSLINRMTVGSTKLKTINEANFVVGVREAVPYDPDTNVPEGSEKAYIADCLIPFVKAFFMGFFNDESYGATHWAHFKSLVKRCPPAYYYAQGTKVNKGNPFLPHQLRAKSFENHYIKDCVFVRVDESLNGQ